MLDKDGSGSISTDELREALSGLSSGLEAAEMDEASIGEIVISMAHSLDSDTPLNGRMATPHPPPTSTSLLHACNLPVAKIAPQVMKSFDRDGSGEISRSEFLEKLEAMRVFASVRPDETG